MWNRKALKANAKELLKINYWKALVATIVLGICTGATTIARSQTVVDEGAGRAFVEEIRAMEPKTVFSALAAVFLALVSVYLVGFLLAVFVGHPLEAGAQKLFINCRENHAEYGNIVYFFKSSYGHIVKTMFLKWLFTKLWSFLFVIPGVVKFYEYRMIPYLLAENPQMSSREVFSRSREMMRGNKWDAFMLDLSFFGWHILGICTFGIVELFYSLPYNNLTNAELYHQLKNPYQSTVTAKTYDTRKDKMGRKFLLPGLLPLLAAAFLVLGAAASLNRVGFDRIALNDWTSAHNGWKYEIRTASGSWREVVPQSADNLAYVLAEQDSDVVKISRIMEEFLENASLEMGYRQCGVAVYLDETLIYSDFATTEGDVREAKVWEEYREIMVRLPEDYYGKRLELEIYFPETAAEKCLPSIILQSRDALAAERVMASIPSTFWMAFMGCLLLTVAVFAAVSQYHGQSDPKLVAMFLVYAVMFGISVYRSEAGYYSGLQGQVDEFLDRFKISVYLTDRGLGGHEDEVLVWIHPVNIDMFEILMLAFGAVFLLTAIIWDSRKKQQKVPWGRIVICSLAAFFVAVLQRSSETGGGLSGLWNAVRRTGEQDFASVLRLCSLTIIYAVTLLTVVQFIWWRLGEWRKQALFLERSRFAVKNYEMIMRVDEDSRRRKHEMKHHMETLYALLDAGEIDQVKRYTEKMIKDTELSADVNYSTNIVLNSIVGIRLNQAKKRGVAVQCHIHVPDQLSVDEVDLNILLSNMLENALEACMRMGEGQETYIGLEIRKRQKFLYIECTNSVAPEELAGKQCRTMKEDVKNHGFGLEAMETVAEKYASIIQTEQSESRYTVRTNLCLAE